MGPRTKRSDDNAVFQHERPEPCGKCVSGHCTGLVRRGRFVCSAELSAGGCPSDLWAGIPRNGSGHRGAVPDRLFTAVPRRGGEGHLWGSLRRQGRVSGPGVRQRLFAGAVARPDLCVQGLRPPTDAEAFGGGKKESEPHREDPDPRGDQRRYRQGRAGRLPRHPRCGDRSLLPHGRHQRGPASADGNAGGRKCRRLRRAWQL